MITTDFDFDFFSNLPTPATEDTVDFDVFDALPAPAVSRHVVKDQRGAERVVRGAGMGWHPAR